MTRRTRRRRIADPVEQATAAARAAELIRPGSITEVRVLHDPSCRQLAGRGDCNCSPDVEIHPIHPAETGRN